MKKHKFNIFPEGKAEDYQRLREDIRTNGFDAHEPITLYQDDVLDGWSRKRACDELKVAPAFRQFEGDDSEAIAFVMRTNKRRNLNSGQWAAIAIEAEEIIEAIGAKVDKDRRDQLSKANSGLAEKVRPDAKQERRTADKVAKLFNTNESYVRHAANMKAQAPEVFEKVKAGKMMMKDGARAVRAIPTEPWLEDEKKRKAAVSDGETVVANTNRDKNLIQWAEEKGIAVRIDRSTEYGNPFLLEADGTRDEVCDAYRDHYLPYKPSIRSKLRSLRGKVLVCHCYPERCHGDELAKFSLK